MLAGERRISECRASRCEGPAHSVVIEVQVTGLYTTCACHIRVEGVFSMIAVKLTGIVTKDHRLELTMPPSVPLARWRSLSSIQSLPLAPVSGDASSLLVPILLLDYRRIVRISATRAHLCHSFAIVWKPAAMPSHERLVDTTILVDLLRWQEAALPWVNGVALQDQWVSVITYLAWLAGCRNRREQRLVAREIHQDWLLHRTEDISRTALA
jgi:hypothetical protein